MAVYSCDLQVYKHVQVQERVPRLNAWFEGHRHQVSQMQWYEFSASTGSTLGILCVIAYAFSPDCSDELTTKVKNSYFPCFQELHILLDYFIDQEEDRTGSDLNFRSYYNNEQEMMERFIYFIQQADKAVSQLPHKQFY